MSNSTYDFKKDDTCFFEYHCLESKQSSDAHLWERTHN